MSNAEKVALDALSIIFGLASEAIRTRHLGDYFPPEIDAIREEAREAMLAIKHHQDRARS